MKRNRTLPLSIALLAAFALSACVHDAEQLRPPVAAISTVAVATAQDVYAAELGDTRYEQRNLRLENTGYTVESGNLVSRGQGVVGMLVLVRSPDGTVMGIVDRPGHRGVLHVGIDGQRKFTAEPPADYLQPDTVETHEAAQPPSTGTAQPAATQYIDMLVVYTKYALEKIGEDPVAYALAQLETVNLGVQNSKAGDVRLRLAGVRVHDVDYNTSSDGLRAFQNMMTPLRSHYFHDMNAAFSGSGGVGGRAYMPGYTSANAWFAPTAFRHEFGHNVGGNHCNTGGADNYKFGFDNGQGARTFLCGNNVPYYSTPDVSLNGHPLGNARTADMARLWRAQTYRMTSYSPAFPGERMLLVVMNTSNLTARITVKMTEQVDLAGFVALTEAVGPTRLDSKPEVGTALSVPLQHELGETRVVKLRGFQISCAGTWRMNYPGCLRDKTQTLELKFMPSDNASLPSGQYNGALQLKAVASNGSQEVPILVSISVKVP